MNRVFCLAEQLTLPAVRLLQSAAAVEARLLSECMAVGWDQPLLLVGEALRQQEIALLVSRTYRNPAPLLIVPPLPLGDVTQLLEAPAPVTVIRQPASRLQIIDPQLRQFLQRDELQILCNEAIATALRSEILATANQQPVIWAYRPTRAATPVLWVAPQLLLVSARTDPVDREELVTALLAWAATQIRTPNITTPTGAAAAAEQTSDPALLRSIVMALAIHPHLRDDLLTAWLQQYLDVAVTPSQVAGAFNYLGSLGALDATGTPVPTRLAELVNAWGLRAWVREVQRLEDTS